MMKRLGRNAVPPFPCHDQLVHLPAADDEIGRGRAPAPGRRGAAPPRKHRAPASARARHPATRTPRFWRAGQLRHPLLHRAPDGFQALRTRRRRCESRPASARPPSTSCPSVRAPARVQALAQPGARVARSSLSTSSAVVSGFSSGQTRPSTRCSRRRRPARVPARARRPSATPRVAAAESSSRPWRTAPDPWRCWRAPPCRTLRPPPGIAQRLVHPAELHRRHRPAVTPGNVVGMNSRSPSSTRGRNSPPSRVTIGKHDDRGQRRGRERQRRSSQGERHERSIDPDQPAGDRVVELGHDAAAQQPIAQRRRDGDRRRWPPR